jgi:hypothetical protein
LASTLPSAGSQFHFIRDALSSSQLFRRNNDENTYDRLPPAALAAIGVAIAFVSFLLISIAAVMRRRRRMADKRRRLRFYFMSHGDLEKPGYPSGYPFTVDSGSSPTSGGLRLGPRFSPSVRSSLHYGGAGGSGFAYMEREMVEIPSPSSLPTEKGRRELSPNRGQRLGRVPRVSRNGSKSSTHSTRSGRSESESGHSVSEGMLEKSSHLSHGISMSESDLPRPLLSPPPAYNNKMPDRDRERRSGDSSSGYI